MLRHIQPNHVITGWDFSTGAVKCLAFDIQGHVLAESRFPTDLWEKDGAIELNLLQLEGQARQTTREIAAKLRALGRLKDWVAGGISATHHTSGRVTNTGGQVRRAICWNDQTLAEYHAMGLSRLGGMEAVRRHIGGPWAIRYTLSHWVKDEQTLSEADWERTFRVTTHGGLAAGYLTGNFDVLSVSAAASTGVMDLRRRQWSREMLHALEHEANRQRIWEQLPKIVDGNEPVGPLSASLALECGLPEGVRPLIFPTSDDQQAGLVGGGAVDDGEMAIILGNSAVVNGSCDRIPPAEVNLDVMALNWGPYLLMRCYSNGAYFMDRVLGDKPDFAALEAEARTFPPGAGGAKILPFLVSEPSLGIHAPRLEWVGEEPKNPGQRYRACLEALAELVRLGVEEHRRAGQNIRSITVSGGVAKSDLMCEILASTLRFPLRRLESSEGPALGAAVTALSACENFLRRQAGENDPFTVRDAVRQMVRFRDTIVPRETIETA
ncbi:MAG: FGGY family carbohydrate kinase [Planctomycetia bacterium]|nr:FGGY family carbohydrate kinase [Planctomycetia bacterium]